MKNPRTKHTLRAFFLFFLLIGAIGLLSIAIYQSQNTDQIPPPASSDQSNTSSTIVIATPPVVTPTTPPVTPPPVTTVPTVPVKIVSVPKNTTAYKFGMSLGETLLSENDTQLNNELNDIASLGIGWIRFDIQWDYVQPNNAQTFNWTGIDRLIAAAHAHNIKVLPILDYTPTWARTPSCASRGDKCPPANPWLFATFAKAAAQRYTSQGVSDWEIWNEPNLAGSWGSTYGTEGYKQLLQESYVAIKAVNPDATVITGGLGPAADTNGNVAPLTFLTQLYADGGEPYFDAVGMHPYTYPTLPLHYYTWSAWSQLASTTPSLRSIMIANGDGNKKIWLTEYGAATDGPGTLETSATDTKFIGSPNHVTEDLQAQMLGEAIVAVEGDAWTGPLFIYSYKDIGISTSTIENFFGVIRNDGTTKPAYTMIKDLLGS